MTSQHLSGYKDIEYHVIKVRYDEPGNIYTNLFIEATKFLTEKDTELLSINGPYHWSDDFLALDLAINTFN